MAEHLESISAFFPAYNDASTIGLLVERTFSVLEATGRDFEVIVVDDGSRDRTAEVLEACRQNYPERLRVIRHPFNRGYGAALRTGFDAASKELVFYTDGDGQYDPLELTHLLAALVPSTGMVNGYKIKRHDPWFRIVIGRLYNAFVRLLFGVRVRDVNCDFRMLRSEWLTRLDLQCTSGVICLELVLGLELQGCPIQEVPVAHYPRAAGRSEFFRWRSLLLTLGQLVHLFYRARIAGTLVPENVSDPASMVSGE